MKKKLTYTKAILASSLAVMICGCSSKPTGNDIHSWLQKSFKSECYRVGGINVLYTVKKTTGLYNIKYEYKVYLRHNITPDDISVLRRVEVGAGIPSRELNADKKWLDNCLSNTMQESILQNFVNAGKIKSGSLLKLTNSTLMVKSSVGWIPKK